MSSLPAPTSAVPGRTVLLTALALLAFAGNSLLCRAALAPGPGGPALDAIGFTAMRLISGALILLPVLATAPARPGGAQASGHRTWQQPLVLLLYAVPFSLSYVSIPAGAGALILFGCVQLTLLVATKLGGESISPRRWIGAALAFAGLIVLLAPGADDLSAIDPLGAGLMAVAGVAWGLYTLLGRGSREPTRDTARAFAYALPGALLLAVLAEPRVATSEGLSLAIASGALCSGLGYALWYRALAGHSSFSAALSQLLVPLLAAALGALLLGEALNLRWWASAAMVLGGVLLGLRPGSSATSRRT
jgi:drug/metabolite transporter (DMT)-like permease